jgi:putative ABC transport system permease protein
MTSVILRGLMGRKLRTVLTALSIVLGTAMISGTFVVRDQITNAFDAIFTESNQNIDVILTKQKAFVDDNGGQVGPLPASIVDEVKTVPGVAVAEPQVQALGGVVVGGEFKGSDTGAPNLVLSWPSKAFDSTTFIAGHPPTKDGEIVVNKQLAEDSHLRLGQQVGLATEVGVKQVTLVGWYTLGGATSLGGATIVGTTLHDAQQWYDRVGKASTINIKAEPGVSPAELRDRIAKVVGPGVLAETGQQSADRQTGEISDSLGFLTYLLLAFAGASVFVGGFIIFNTFSITVGQRTREFAMLRTIGAARRQVLRAVLAEAVLMGLVASIVGIFAGIGFAKLLNLLFDAAGFGLPSTSISVPLVTAVLLPLAVGMGIALLSALGPAIRATRVPPIAALREGAELPESWVGRHVLPISLGLIVLGAGGMVDGIFRDGSAVGAVAGVGDTAATLISLALGAVLCFIAVAMLSRYVVRPLSSVIGRPVEMAGLGLQYVGRGVGHVPLVGMPLRRGWYAVTRDYVIAALLFLVVGGGLTFLLFRAGPVPGVVALVVVLASAATLVGRWWKNRESEWPPERPSRQAGRLARENTGRNTGRTAVTAAAMMIGVALVVFMGVFVNGFKNSFVDAIDKSITSDLIIQSESFSPIPDAAVAAAAANKDVQTSTGIKFATAKIGKGGTDFVSGVDPTAFGKVYHFDWKDGGSDQLLTSLKPDQALVEENFKRSHKLNIGDRFQVTSIDGNKATFAVAGVYHDPVLMTGITISDGAFDQFSPGNTDPGVLLIDFRPSVTTGQGKAAVSKALSNYPVAKVRTNAEYVANFKSQVDGILSVMYVLLALTVVISLFGIVNTLALSVFERTREIGMLRAVGMTRRQLRRIIRYESVITSIIGGILGVGVGLAFGWIVTKGLEDQGATFAVPIGQLIVCLVVAAVAGMLAAIMPARRAAKLDVLEALQYE